MAQFPIAVDGPALPVDPVVLARENIFEVRHTLRGLELDDEQIEVAEAAVELVRSGRYGTARNATARHESDGMAAAKAWTRADVESLVGRMARRLDGEATGRQTAQGKLGGVVVG